MISEEIIASEHLVAALAAERHLDSVLVDCLIREIPQTRVHHVDPLEELGLINDPRHDIRELLLVQIVNLVRYADLLAVTARDFDVSGASEAYRERRNVWVELVREMENGRAVQSAAEGHGDGKIGIHPFAYRLLEEKPDMFGDFLLVHLERRLVELVVALKLPVTDQAAGRQGLDLRTEVDQALLFRSEVMDIRSHGVI